MYKRNTILSILVLLSTVAYQSSLAAEKSKQDLFSVLSNSVESDTLLAYLNSLDLNYFKGKAVDSFLQKLPAGATLITIMDRDGSRYARYLREKYDTIRILVYVKEFHHLNPKNHNRNWDINLFKLENIACIEIWNRRQRVSPECKWWE